jgi:hypothetical protein
MDERHYDEQRPDERRHDERRPDERRDLTRRDLTSMAASGASAVSWAAVLAGAVAAAAVSLLLLSLASGLDLAALSPDRSAVASLAESTAIALIVTQWISAGLGGFITGRLRTRWVGTHTHEVFFRDTAHGFLTWSVATLLMASGLVSGGGGPAHAGHTSMARAPAALAGSLSARDAGEAGEAQGTSRGEVVLRLTPVGPPGAGLAPERGAPPDGDTPSERAARVAGHLLLPEEPANTRDADVTFLARLARAPGTRDARQGVAWQGSDAERQDAATISIFTALSMLVGAFIACVSAALGGRLRDRHP